MPIETSEAVAAELPLSAGGEKTYKVGTLVYTRSALITVMFWMLWGDLALQMMERLPSLIPLQMKWLGASDKLVGLVKDSLQAALTVCFVPIIGMQSDRHRGPMGRRRPFLLWCTFPVCIFLIATGFVEPISRTVHGFLKPVLGSAAPASVGLVLIAFFIGGFFFFNNYILQIYQYLITDVVPREVMGKFIGFYRAVGAISGFVFSKYIFGYAETHIGWIYIGCSLFYLFGFMLLIWQVKEGEYPPPDMAKERVGPIKFIHMYAKDCYTHSFYWKIYIAATLYWTAMVPFNTYIILYGNGEPEGGAMTSLGMSPGEFGNIQSWTFLPTVVIFALCGFMVDYFHSLRVLIVGFIATAITFYVGYGLACAQPYTQPQKSLTEEILVTVTVNPDKSKELRENVVKTAGKTDQERKALLDVSKAPPGTYKYLMPKYYRPSPAWLLWWWIFNQITLAVVALAYLAIFPALFPRTKFGQFFSANQLIFSVGLIGGPFVCGYLLDIVHDRRVIFIWSATWVALAAWMTIALYRHWKRLGGDKHYTPPGVEPAPAIAV